jgi:hypothetical protein
VQLDPFESLVVDFLKMLKQKGIVGMERKKGHQELCSRAKERSGSFPAGSSVQIGDGTDSADISIPHTGFAVSRKRREKQRISFHEYRFNIGIDG